MSATGQAKLAEKAYLFGWGKIYGRIFKNAK